MKAIPVSILTVSSILFSANLKAQTDKHPITDADKIADALAAAPEFITKDTTILDWPAKPGGEFRVLRKGTSEWTCVPTGPAYSHASRGATTEFSRSL
jgi:hypothetical protein